MHAKRTLSASFVLFAILSFAKAQAGRAGNTTQRSRATLLQIIRAEDERRWDETLKTLLKSDDARVRSRAALAAGRIGDERAVPELAEMLLTDKDADVRQVAAFALGEVESARGAYALITVLKDSSKPGRARAVEALGKIAGSLITVSDNKKSDDRLETFRSTILDALIFEDSRRSNPDKLTILLGLTAVLRARPQDAGPVVTKFLDYSDPSIVATALNTMARLRLKDANERVRELLKDNDPIVRANAARVIGAAEHKEAFDDLLAKALNDTDLRVRVSAIRSLALLKDARATQPLLDRGILLLNASDSNHGGISTADIGLPECDKFLTWYEACVSTKVPEAARDQYRKAIEQWRSAWKQVAANPSTKGTLATACRQAVVQQKAALAAYGCTVQTSEILEFVTALGRLVPKNTNSTAVEWLKSVHEFTKGEAVEVEVALARIAPVTYVSDPFKAEAARPNATWRQISRRAQGLAAIKDVISETADGSAGAQTLQKAKEELAARLRNPNTPTLAVSDVLQAYAGYKPSDVNQIALTKLQSADPVVRSAAAGVIENQPPSEANARALIEALPRALRDRDLNDAALSILDALGKQKTASANEAIKSGLDSPDQLVRRRAVNLLKANGAGDFSDRIGRVKSSNTDLDYRRAIGRTGRKVTATVVTSRGSFVIEFLPADAPLTVDNFVKLARKGYFNGQTIPRVVPNFVIQAGDPRGDQNGGPGYSIRCEINEVPYERTSVGMALSGKDTGGSQWFVTHSPQPHLDGGYTVFGHVTSGMDVVDRIERGDKILRIVVNEL